MERLINKERSLFVLAVISISACSGSGSGGGEDCMQPISVTHSEYASWDVESSTESFLLSMEVAANKSIVVNDSRSNEPLVFELVERDECRGYDADVPAGAAAGYVVHGSAPVMRFIEARTSDSTDNLNSDTDALPPPVVDQTCHFPAGSEDKLCEGEFEYEGVTYTFEETRDVVQPAPGAGIISFSLYAGGEQIYRMDLNEWNGL